MELTVKLTASLSLTVSFRACRPLRRVEKRNLCARTATHLLILLIFLPSQSGRGPHVVSSVLGCGDGREQYRRLTHLHDMAGVSVVQGGGGLSALGTLVLVLL